MKRISNLHIQNFLEEHGVNPVDEYYGVAYYRRTPLLLSLLEDYNIRYFCFPNKLG